MAAPGARRARRACAAPPRPAPPAHPCGALASLIAPNPALGPMARPTACRLCGGDIEPRGRGSRPAYCRRCTARADKKAAQRPRADCKECGKAFATGTRAVRYCSDACRTVAARRSNAESQRRYRADPQNHARMLALARASAARRAAERGERAPRRATCDVKSLRRNRTSAEPYPCALCGRDFAPYGGRRPIHCKQCSARVDREIARERTLNCKECGKRFSTLNRIVRYCSKECNVAGRSRISAESRSRRLEDPETRALALARQRAWAAARKAKEKGSGGGQRNA